MVYFITNQLSLYDQYSEHNITVTSDLNILEHWLAEREAKQTKWFALDTETTGHDPHKDKVILIQLGDKYNQFVIDCQTVKVKSLLDKYLPDKSWLKYLHNAKFDYKMILGTYNIKLENVYDSFLVEMIIQNGLKFKGFGLKDLVEKYSKERVVLDKTIREGFGTNMGHFTIPQVKYAAADVQYFECIVEAQATAVAKNNLQNTVKLENEIVLAYADMEYNGLGFNSEEWLKIAHEQESELRITEKKLDEYLIKKANEDPKFKPYVSSGIPQSLFPDMELPKEKKGTKAAKTHNRSQILVDWNSSSQLIPIFKLHGIDVQYTDVKTNDTRDSISGPILEKNMHLEFIQLYKKYKELQKQVSTYGSTFLEYIHPITGRVHTNFAQLGTETGRVSSKTPNLQNIPARSYVGSKQRKCFVASKGYKLITADYSQAEIRIVADIANESGLIESLNKNEDPYGYAGTKMFKMPVSKKENADKRDISKAIILGLNYGMGPNKLASKLNCTIEEAKMFIQLFNTEMPAIANKLKQLNKFGITQGYAITIDKFQRKRWFKTFKQALIEKGEGDNFMLSKIGREAQNMPIQGMNANLTKLATMYLRDFINKYNIDAKIVNQVHDEIVVEARENIADKLATKIVEIMRYAGKQICKNVIMDATYHIDDCWSK